MRVRGGSGTIGFYYKRAFEEPTDDAAADETDYTEIYADRDWIVAEAMANLRIPGWKKRAQARARIMGYGSDPNLLITPNPPVAV